ncbi:hypothetical protein [Cohnella sp. JJ-181]|uniref:hypothetical protein n=1 Tax=Cohnella rhizoplanae TaxID=2974897 RepID=UPI00232F2C41|nr:hypothetical protein [Cohnella sp. JJ-181]
MLLIGCFYQTIELEHALADIERSGIDRRHILAVGMDQSGQPAPEALQSDAIEMGAGWATAFAVIGVAAGFGLAWGPIVWGLIGTAAGFGTGWCIHRFRHRGGARSGRAASPPEVTVIVQCPSDKSDAVRSVMYRCGALSVGTNRGP